MEILLIITYLLLSSTAFCARADTTKALTDMTKNLESQTEMGLLIRNLHKAAPDAKVIVKGEEVSFMNYIFHHKILAELAPGGIKTLNAARRSKKTR